MSDFKELVKNLYTSKNRELTPEKFDYIQKTYTGKEQDFVKNFYATIGEDLTEEKLNYINDTYLKKKEPSRLQPSATQLPSVGGGFLQGLPELPKEALKEPKQSTSVPKQPQGNQFLDIGTPVTQPQEVRGATVVPKKGQGVIDAPFARGVIQGKIANILATGKKPSKEELVEVAKLNQDLQTLGASDAQTKFDQQGFALFKNEPLKGVEFLAETIGNSLAALAVSGTRTIPAAIGIGTAAGAPIAGIGAAAGAGAGLVAGMSTAGMNLSTSSKVLDVLRESGIDIANEDSLIKGFSDEKLMAKARTKALKYGIPILIFDAATGGIAGKLTSTAAKATLGKKLLAGAGELGIQGVGAGAGEAAGQYAAEGKIDPTEVALEAIAGTATNIPEIIAGSKIERSKASSSNKNIAQQISVLGKEAGKEDAIVNLQRDLNNGVIDEKEFNEGIEFVEKAAAIDDKIPQDLQGEKRAKSIELIDSRLKLEDELKAIEGQKEKVDVAFHAKLDEQAKEIKFKIDGINNDILELSKQKTEANAVPEQTTNEVPVQSETTVSEEVEGGTPETKLESITQEEIPITQINEEVAPINKDNLQRFTTKSKKQVVTFENGDLIVRDSKTNKEVSDKTKKKALQEFAETFDYTVGERAPEPSSDMQFKDENELNEWVIENSQNPYELATIYANQEPTSQPLSSTEKMIADYGIGKVKGGSYNEFGDRNNMTLSKARTYINKQGRSLDVIAKEISDHYDVEITPQDLVDFMDRFPNGEISALKLVESDVARSAADKFKALTGLNLNSEIAQKAIEQQFNKLSKAEQLIAQQDYESAEQLEAAYWSEYEQTNGFTEEGNLNQPQQEEKGNGNEQPKEQVGGEPIAEAKPKQEDVELKTPLEEKYEQINKLRGEKVKELAKQKLISDNFDSIVAQLMTKNKIKRQC